MHPAPRAVLVCALLASPLPSRAPAAGIVGQEPGDSGGRPQDAIDDALRDARAARATGAAARAEEAARAAARLAGELGDGAREAGARRLVAELLTERSAHAEALVLLERCVELDAGGARPAALADDWRRIGDARSWLGQPVDALEAYEEAVRTARENELPSPVPPATLGAWYAWFGRYEEARAKLDEALALAGEPGVRVHVLSNLATLESARGRYANALRLLDRALVESRAAEDSAAEGATLVLKGGIETELGRPADAERTLRTALEKLDPGRSALQRAYAWMQIGLARIDAGRAADSLPMLERARTAFEALEFEIGGADVLQHRARALLDLGRLDEAAGAWEETADRRRAARSPFQLALALTGLGDARERAGGTAAARAAYAAALEAAAGLGSPEATWRARYGLGRALEADGEAEAALAAYRAALADVESIRVHLEGPALRLEYLESKLGLYRRAARLAARAGALEDAFRWTEAARARTLRERFRPAPDEDVEPSGPAAARVAAAEEALTLLEIKAAGARRATDAEDVRADFDARLAAARAEHAEALRALERGAPRHARLAGATPPPSLAAVRARLAPGVAVVEYLFGPEVHAAWVVRREGARFVELRADPATVQDALERLERPARELRAGRTTIASLAFDAGAARALYDALVAPLAAGLAGAGEVWIVPDGPLWRAPFAAFASAHERRPADPGLAYAQHRGARFWIDDVALGLLPCAALVLAPPRAREEGPSRALLVADPSPLPAGSRRLAGARREVEAVRTALAGAPALVLAGEAARESDVRAALGAARLVHLAAHGELDDARPAYSRLVLAPGGGADGYLHAFEVEALALDAEHVFLSACETAGATLAGEGVLGLPRAFLIAGARSVLASTRVVDDEAAAELARRYYLALGSGARPVAALRAAQLGMAREAERPGLAYAHPFFWSGYVLVGAP